MITIESYVHRLFSLLLPNLRAWIYEYWKRGSRRAALTQNKLDLGYKVDDVDMVANSRVDDQSYVAFSFWKYSLFRKDCQNVVLN